MMNSAPHSTIPDFEEDELDRFEPLPVPRRRLGFLALLLLGLFLFYLAPSSFYLNYDNVFESSVLARSFEYRPHAARFWMLIVGHFASALLITRLAGAPMITVVPRGTTALAVLAFTGWIGYFAAWIITRRLIEESLDQWVLQACAVAYLVLIAIDIAAWAVARPKERALLLGLMPAFFSVLYHAVDAYNRTHFAWKRVLGTGPLAPLRPGQFEETLLRIGRTLFLRPTYAGVFLILGLLALRTGLSVWLTYRRQRSLEREFQEAMRDRRQ